MADTGIDDFSDLKIVREKLSNGFLEFMSEACSHYHAVDSVRNRFLQNGFEELYETEQWSVVRGGKYFFIRNATTIFAFAVGKLYQPGHGFISVCAHTDSPCLRVQPVSCTVKSDALMLNLFPYGGGLWHTWFDRDLGLAGRIVTKSSEGKIASQLVRIDRAVARIPTLAIHLQAGQERESFAPNLHEHVKAILTISPELVRFPSTVTDSSLIDHAKRMNPALVNLIALEANIDPLSIVNLDLQLTDIQPPSFGGANSELIFSGRLDNLCSAYQAMQALIDSTTDEMLANQANVCTAILFDHEEVGSSSCQGAASSLFMDTIRLILSHISDNSNTTFSRTLRKSFIASVDMAHAIHPNYAAKHDANMAPKLNGGLVVKHNANQRYATSTLSSTVFREIAGYAGVPIQEFAVRADSGCGSTIGPILATLSGITTIDCGTPQLSMHSIREMMGADDVYNGYIILKNVYEKHSIVSENIRL